MIEITQEMIARCLEKAKEIERSNVQACMDEFSKLGQRSYPPEQMIEAILKAALDFSDEDMLYHWHISYQTEDKRIGSIFVGNNYNAIPPSEVNRAVNELNLGCKFVITSVSNLGFMPRDVETFGSAD